MTDQSGQTPGPSRVGATSARGIALLVGAVVLGIILLKATDPPDSLADAAQGAVREGTTTSTTVTSTTDEPADDEATSTTEEPAEEEGGALVLVANAADQPGVAGRLTDTLEQAEFVVAPPANATVDVPTSIVYFAPGFEEAAGDVAELFDPHPALLTDFDGTLSPIVEDPAAAVPLPGAVEVLARLGER